MKYMFRTTCFASLDGAVSLMCTCVYVCSGSDVLQFRSRQTALSIYCLERSQWALRRGRADNMLLDNGIAHCVQELTAALPPTCTCREGIVFE